MRRHLTTGLTAIATMVALLAVVGASPSPSAGAATTTSIAATSAAPSGAPSRAIATSERKGSSLRVTPKRFVGGQLLTFAGRIPGAGNKRLKLQSIFNRPGDKWITRSRKIGSTDRSGQFRFTHIAPSNYNIRYRVRAANGRTSKVVKFQPRQQEVTLRLNGGQEQQRGQVARGQGFRIAVNTTPTGRGDLGRPPPAFPGRTLDLQQRVNGNQWQTIASTTSDSKGQARFYLNAGEPGLNAYRVRQAAIHTGGNRIGWFPSFPLEVRFVDSSGRRTTTSATEDRDPGSDETTTASPRPIATTSARSGGGNPQASARYKWGPTHWDFAWESGESLTDKPYRGRNRTGYWIDRSNGSGRAAAHNGGLALESNISEFAGKGDHGANSVTLAGNAITYGRWEFRRRIDVFERKVRSYRAKIELVPANAADAACGANTINVATVGFNSRKATLGVTSSDAKKAWTGSKRISRMGDNPHSWSVEVTRSSITWFLNGRSLATVKNRQAVPGVPLTPRLSLIGKGQKEMQRTRVLYDWQRGWTLNKQARKAQKGSGLKVKNLQNAC